MRTTSFAFWLLLLAGNYDCSQALVTPPAVRASTFSRPALTTATIAVGSITTSTRLFNVLDDIFGGESNSDKLKSEEPNGSSSNNREDSTGTSTSRPSFRPLNDDGSSPPSNSELESLQGDMLEQSSVLMGLELAMEELQLVLNNKEVELDRKQDSWSQEKTGFVAKLAELTSSIQQYQQAGIQESESEGERDADYTVEQERLKREILLLKNQQKQVGSRLEQERVTNDELQNRLTKVNDSLEFEQMIFFKEKNKLQATLAAQKQQLSEVKRKLQREESKFGNSQENAQLELQQEQDRLASTQSDINRMQKEYELGQTMLQDQVKEEERVLKEAQRNLKNERRKSQQERDRLQAQLEQEKATLEGLEDTIEQERDYFNSMQPLLVLTMAEEKVKVEELSKRLQSEQTRFSTETNGLEDRIEAEQKRLTVVEGQLKLERSQFDKVKDQLTYEQTLIQVNRAEDRSRMSDRFDALREALQNRVQEEKRRGREAEESITERYETTLTATQNAITQLKDQVQATNLSRDNMQLLVSDVKRQTQQIYTDKQQSEVRYQRLLSDRDMEVGIFQKNLRTLEMTDNQRGEDIQRVESSYREIAKYSLKLTAKRINKVNPLRLFKRGERSKKKQQQEQ